MPKLEARRSKHEPLGKIYVSNINKGVSFPSFDGFCEMSGVGTEHTKTNLSAQRRFICPGETKGKKQETRERGEKGQRRWRRDICPRGTKVCLWIESRDCPQPNSHLERTKGNLLLG